MLCSILAQTGVAGRPAEFFGPTLSEEFRGNRNIVHAESVGDYLDGVIAASTTTNGVFGTKLLASQTEVFLRRAAEHKSVPFASLHEALESEFPSLYYIWLRRENVVAQAISFYRALTTQTWIVFGNSLPHLAATPKYDRFAIQRCYQDIMASEAYWDGYFKTHDISPLVVTYEEMLAEREAVMQHLLRYLDLPTDIPIPMPKTAKIADKESLAWEEEFRRTDSIPEAGAQPPKIWGPY